MYNKIFSKIVDSSIWSESESTRIVWVTFIAVMDEQGFVPFAGIDNVARRAHVPFKKAETAIIVLESPDPNSSDPANEGRRIERVPGGWMVLNSQKYRDMVTRAIVQEQTRLRVARFRENRKPSNAKVTPKKRSVTPSEEETEAQSEAETHTPKRDLPRVPGTTTALSVEECAKVDALDEDIAFEERRFTSLALPIRDTIQAVLDSLPRPASRAPFSASRWSATGRTGINRSQNALTVLRLTNDALEARQRAQDVPIISEKNRQSLAAIEKITGVSVLPSSMRRIEGVK